MEKVIEEVLKEDPATDPPTVDELKARLVHILKISCGAGMQDLNRKGYFKRPDDEKERPQKGTPLYYYIRGDDGIDANKPKRLEPDAHWGKIKKIKKCGDVEILEYLQWGWVVSWDKKFTETKGKGLEVLNDPPDEAPRLQQPFWPSDYSP